MSSINIQNGKIIKSINNFVVEIRPFEIIVKNMQTNNELKFSLIQLFNDLPDDLKNLLSQLVNEVQLFYETVLQNYFNFINLLKALKSSS